MSRVVGFDGKSAKESLSDLEKLKKNTLWQTSNCSRRLIQFFLTKAPAPSFRDEGDSGARRWLLVSWRSLWRARLGLRRSLLQHVDERLSGDLDRSLIQGTDRHDDLPADWKLRRESRRR